MARLKLRLLLGKRNRNTRPPAVRCWVESQRLTPLAKVRQQGGTSCKVWDGS